MDLEKFIRNAENNRFTVRYFETGREAADYLCAQIRNKTVGFGDSHTLHQMGLADALRKENPAVYDPFGVSNAQFGPIAKAALTTQIYLTSVNAASESGELVNIDSSGNRVAGSLYGHEKVYFVFSADKIEPTLEKAIFRAKNIAAPINAHRFGFKTPCAVKGDKCYNCSSPDRICNTLTIYMKKEKSMEEELVVIGEKMGF